MARSFRSIPLRYQIRKELLNLIVEKGYQPGDQLPTEEQLGEMLDVSRFSLREALHLLEVERLISTRHGKGRFLLAPPRDISIDITSLQSVPDLLSGFGIESIDKIIKIVESDSRGEISTHLNLDDGTPIVSIWRLRYAGKIPIIFSIDTLARKRLPETFSRADLKGSLFTFLEEQCGLRLDHSLATLRAARLPEEIQEEVGNHNDSWILMEQVICDREGEAIIYSKDYHHTDYITFHVRRYRR